MCFRVLLVSAADFPNTFLLFSSYSLWTLCFTSFNCFLKREGQGRWETLRHFPTFSLPTTTNMKRFICDCVRGKIRYCVCVFSFSFDFFISFFCTTMKVIINNSSRGKAYKNTRVGKIFPFRNRREWMRRRWKFSWKTSGCIRHERQRTTTEIFYFFHFSPPFIVTLQQRRTAMQRML